MTIGYAIVEMSGCSLRYYLDLNHYTGIERKFIPLIILNVNAHLNQSATRLPVYCSDSQLRGT